MKPPRVELVQARAGAIGGYARAGFMVRFEHEAEPDGVLPPEERKRRADHALKAHMQGDSATE